MLCNQCDVSRIGDYQLLLNFQPRIMRFWHSDRFSQSRLSAYTLYFDLIGETTKFLSDKAAEKGRFRELSTEETTEKTKQKMAYRQRPNSHKVWFEII